MCVRVHFLKSSLFRKQTISSRKNADDAVRNEQEKTPLSRLFFPSFSISRRHFIFYCIHTIKVDLRTPVNSYLCIKCVAKLSYHLFEYSVAGKQFWNFFLTT